MHSSLATARTRPIRWASLVLTVFRGPADLRRLRWITSAIRLSDSPPATPAHAGGFSQYDPSNNSLIIAGVGNNPSDLGLRKNLKDFGPRLGIAYRYNDKTVIRTGFGISYAPFPDNAYAYNYPIKQ